MSISVKSIFNKKIITQNEARLNHLKEMIQKKEDVTWVLGAGISCPFDIPLWDTLLRKMWARLVEADVMKTALSFEKKDINKNNYKECYYDDVLVEIYKEYYKSSGYKRAAKKAMKDGNEEYLKGFNLLEFAEYIRNSLAESGKKLSETEKQIYSSMLKILVKESLYSKYDFNKMISNDSVLKQLGQYLSEKTDRMNLVISYNYDEILERCIKNKLNDEFTDRVNIIVDNSKFKKKELEKINIIHVHGFLPEDEELKAYESDEIVLTETSYDEVGRYAYKWINTVQSEALMNSSNIFLGFSGQDGNFRRILKNIDKNKDKEHFMFVSINSFVSKCSELGKKSPNREKRAYEEIQLLRYLQRQEEYWKKYNIFPIWTTHDELFDMIKEILT